MNIRVQVSMWIHVFISLGYISRSGSASFRGNYMFDSLRSCQMVFQCLNHCTFPPAMWEGSNFSTSLSILVFCIFYYSWYFDKLSSINYRHFIMSLQVIWNHLNCHFSSFSFTTIFKHIRLIVSLYPNFHCLYSYSKCSGT